MPFNWTLLNAVDLSHVSRIAAAVHPGFPEDDAVFAERLRLYPDGCWMLRVADMPTGYLLSHPMPFGHIPALNAVLGALAEDADTCYIHDLALLPEARGTGAASQIVSALSAHAVTAGYATMSLVAVNSSRRFWERHGFSAVERTDLYAKLQSYEANARFMVRKLD